MMYYIIIRMIYDGNYRFEPMQVHLFQFNLKKDNVII